MWHHNGTESQDLLPLWKEDGEAIPSRRPVAVVLRETRHRNGTESQDLLPLWKEDGEAIPSREHVAVVLRETRHRNGTESQDLLPLWKEDGEGNDESTDDRESQCRRSPPAGLLVQTQFRMAVRGAAEQH